MYYITKGHLSQPCKLQLRNSQFVPFYEYFIIGWKILTNKWLCHAFFRVGEKNTLHKLNILH